MDIKEIVIARAQRRNHFQDQGHEDADHACMNCVRRQFSFPWTCSDGWPLGDQFWRDRGARCVNWTDQGNASVD